MKPGLPNYSCGPRFLPFLSLLPLAFYDRLFQPLTWAYLPAMMSAAGKKKPACLTYDYLHS
jgi:hypothetical protein